MQLRGTHAKTYAAVAVREAEAARAMAERTPEQEAVVIRGIRAIRGIKDDLERR